MRGPHDFAAATASREQWEGLTNEVRSLKSSIHPPVPNPAPLGLFAFGLTTALLQMKHARIAGDSAEDADGTEVIVLGFAMFFGGLLQIIAGLCEIRRNNIFGFTAFLLYGGFWMSVGTVDIIQVLASAAAASGSNGEYHVPNPNPKTSQAMLFLVGCYTVILWICTFKLNKTLNALFFLLSVTVFLLVGGVRNETIDTIGGYFGIVTSAMAYWLAFAELMNDIHGEGKEIIPLGHFNSNQFGAHGAFQAPGRIQAAHHDHDNHHRLGLFKSIRNFASSRHINSNTTTNNNNHSPTASVEPADIEHGEAIAE